MVLRKMFGPKRDEITGEWRKLHNEELNNLYSSPNIIIITIIIYVMELGHLLTLSGLTCLEVTSEVCRDSFCHSGSSVSLPWVNYYEAFCLQIFKSSYLCFRYSIKHLLASDFRCMLSYCILHLSRILSSYLAEKFVSCTFV
jgi:hypothetical protein